MDPFQCRHVHHPRAVTADQQPGSVQLVRKREESAFGNRLRAPGETLAPFENVAHEQMRLQLLQQIVHRELDVAIVQPHDHSERDHVLAHRVDEGAAELAVLRLRAERPTHRVNHAVERLRHLPHFLDAERPDLRVLAVQAEAFERDAGEVALRSLGEHGHARDDVGSRLEVP